MEQLWTENKIFDNLDFNPKNFPWAEYENCQFINCNFAEADLSDRVFIDCKFTGCNLSMIKLNNTAMRNVRFTDCKILGANWEACNRFGLEVTFEKCNLNYASFFCTPLSSTVFSNCQLHDTDFSECDLSGAVFEECDLSGAIFAHTVLENADFKSARNYSIDPERNNIKNAEFSLPDVIGLLDKYQIKIG